MNASISASFLRRVLWIDAASCGATGALQLSWTDALGRLLGLPPALLVGTGLFLFAYGAIVVWAATRDPVPRGLVVVFVIGNLLWALDALLLAAGLGFQPTGLGVGYLVLQALVVTVLAVLQAWGLRRGVTPARA